MRYKVRLESPIDSHSREVTLSANSPAEARARCEAQEQRLVGYSILPSTPVAPKSPYGNPHGGGISDSLHPLEVEQYERALALHRAELESFPTRLEVARQELQGIEEAHGVGEDGRVYGPDARTRARLHAHLQAKPYRVATVEEAPLAPIELDRLVSELANIKQDPARWQEALQALREAGIPMAAVTAYMFGVPIKNQYDGTSVTDWDTDTIKVALTTSTYTPDQDTHDFFNDVTNEVTGTGYTAGGATLASKTATYDTATNTIRLDAADTSWTSSTITARKAIVYKSTGTSTTSPLIGQVDFGADVSTTAGTFQITWDATGIIVLTAT